MDDLLHLALVDAPLERGVWQENAAHELLGDGGASATGSTKRVQRGGDKAERVETRVLPVGLIFNDGGGVDEDAWDLAKPNRLAQVGAKVCELNRPSTIKDARVLAEHDGVKVARVGEIGHHAVVDPDSAHICDHGNEEADREEGEGEEYRQPAATATRSWGTLGAVRTSHAHHSDGSIGSWSLRIAPSSSPTSLSAVSSTR